MKFFVALKLAFYNIKSIRRGFFRTLSGLTIALLFLSACAIIQISFTREITSNFDKFRTIGRVEHEFYPEYDEDALKQSLVSNKDISEFKIVQNVPSVFGINSHIINDNPPVLMADGGQARLEDTELILNGTHYSWQAGEDAWLIVSAFDDNHKMLLDSEISEFNARFKNERYLISGTKPDDAGEIALPERYINGFGISDYSLIIGQNITFEVKPLRNNDQTAGFLQDFKVTGILNDNLYKVDSLKYEGAFITSGNAVKGEYFADFFNDYLSGDDIKAFEQYRPLKKCVAQAKNYDSFLALIDWMEEKHSFTYETGQWNFIYVPNASLEFIYLGKVQRLVNSVLLAIGLIILFAVLVNLAGSLNHMIIKKTGYFGLLMALGLTKKKLFLIFFFELLIICLLAVLVSLAILTPVLFIFQTVINSMSGYYSFPLSFLDISLTFLISFGIFSLVTFILSLLTIGIKIRKQPADLIYKRN